MKSSIFKLTYFFYVSTVKIFKIMFIFNILKVTRKALELINPDKKLPLHVSLDIDVLDPIEAPATGTRGT